MPSIRQKSKSARATFALLGFVIAILATLAIRPVASLAEPVGPPEPPQLAFEPSGFDFGLVQVNSGSQTTLQLRNVATEPVHVDWMEISGGSGTFGYNTDCTVRTLQPNETCFVQVYFNPHDMSEYAAQVRANVGPYSFSADLTGTGGRASFTPASNPTDFGVAAVGSPGTTREIAVANAGNMAGGMFIAVISGGAVGSFHLLDENCTGRLLAPAATCTLQVRFQPLSEGVKTATLSLFGEQDGGTQIALTGVGSAPSSPSGPATTGSAPASTAAPSTDAGSRARVPRRNPRIRRRPRRTGLHTARQVLVAGAERGPIDR